MPSPRTSGGSNADQDGAIAAPDPKQPERWSSQRDDGTLSGQWSSDTGELIATEQPAKASHQALMDAAVRAAFESMQARLRAPW